MRQSIRAIEIASPPASTPDAGTRESPGDRLTIVLDDQSFDDFLDELIEQPEPNTDLRRVLTAPSPWE